MKSGQNHSLKANVVGLTLQENLTEMTELEMQIDDDRG